MSALRIASGISQRAQVMKAGDAALGAWLRLLDWQKSYAENDTIPVHVVEHLVAKKTIKKMVESELLSVDENGYVLVEFTSAVPGQPETDLEVEIDEDEERRAKERARKAKYRELSRVSHGTDTGHVPSDVPDVPRDNDGTEAGQTRDMSQGQTGHVPPTRALSILDLDLKSSLSPANLSKEDLRELEGGVGETIRAATDSGIFPTLVEEKKSKARSTSCPTSEATSIELDAFVAKWKLDPSHPEFEKFLDYHRSKRSLFVDWAAAFRTWARRAEQYAPRKPLLQGVPASGRAWKMGPIL